MDVMFNDFILDIRENFIQIFINILGSSGISVGMIFAMQDFSPGEHRVCRKFSVYLCVLCVLCGKFADDSFICNFCSPT